MYGPTCLAIDKLGNIFIADAINNVIRKINTFGVITTFAGNGFGAGTGMGGHSGNGGPATAAELSSPTGIAFDIIGNLYIADQLNSRIQKVDTNGVITTIAGTGVYGYSGDGSLAISATFRKPTGVAFDSHGNLFITDNYSNCIRKVNTSGIITTVAGNGTQGFSGDGGSAISAELATPYSVSFDKFGNMFVADMGNSLIRKVNTSGIINTVAGGNTVLNDGGPATSARLSFPTSLAFDTMGNMYIADNNDNRIRKVDTFGIISTVVGNGTSVYSGDGGLATAAGLVSPYGIVIDKISNLYIAGDDNRIRKITNINTIGIETKINKSEQTYCYPNPSTGMVNIERESEESTEIAVSDLNGKMLYKQTLNGSGASSIDLSSLQNGAYMLQAGADKFKLMIVK